MASPFSNQSIYIAGHRGMVGSAIVRALKNAGHTHFLLHDKSELDLRNQAAVTDFFATEKPNIIIVAAAKVGGILANQTYPADFLYDNLAITSNLIHAAHTFDAERLLFLGSSCIYPKNAPHPIPETALLTGPLEPTNEAYAIAKIAAIKLCDAYRNQHGRNFHSVMPCNLYGPGDNYHPENSHVIPGLIRRFSRAKSRGEKTVTLWGTGTPRREFLYVDDLAQACVHLLQMKKPPPLINVGQGNDITIFDLATAIAKATGYDGKILTDPEKPDGIARKLMDTTAILATGWKPTVPLQDGLQLAIADYNQQT